MRCASTPAPDIAAMSIPPTAVSAALPDMDKMVESCAASRGRVLTPSFYCFSFVLPVSVLHCPSNRTHSFIMSVARGSVVLIILICLTPFSFSGKWMPVSNDEVVPDVEDYVLDYYGGKIDDEDAPAPPPPRTGAIIRILQPCVNLSKFF